MTAIVPLIPRQSVPDLAVATVGGSHWRLSERTAERFTMVVVYRGLHCPICKGYLADLNRRAEAFAALGVDVLVVSSDDAERAARAKTEWGLDTLTVGYGLTLAQGRAWGLYVSSGRGKTSIGIEEPAHFVEPGLFLIKPDKTLYFGSVQTMPFARPSFGDIEKAIQFVIEKDYPARGEVVELPV